MPRTYYIQHLNLTADELEAEQERLERDRIQERIEAVRQADDKAQKNKQMGQTLIGKGFVELYFMSMREHIRDIMDSAVENNNNTQPVHVQLVKDMHKEFEPVWDELIDIFALTILDSLTEALVLPREIRTEKDCLVNTIVWNVHDTLVREMEYRSYQLRVKADENVNDTKLLASFQTGLNKRRDERHKSLYTHMRIRHDIDHAPAIFEREELYLLLTKIIVEFADGAPFHD